MFSLSADVPVYVLSSLSPTLFPNFYMHDSVGSVVKL